MTRLVMLLALAAACAAYDIVLPPSDTSVYVGAPFTLQCRVVPTEEEDYVEWLEFITSSIGTRISLNEDVQHETNNTKYDIDDNVKFNLIVKNATFQDGGTYGCRRLVAGGAVNEAKVTVFDHPVCSASTQELYEGDETQIKCLVEFGGLEAPEVNFLDGDRRLNISSISTGEHFVEITANFTVTWEDNAKPYDCHVTFDSPSHSDNCTSTMEVAYSVRNANIQPSQDVVYVGDDLLCAANGNPQPQVTWEQVFPPQGGRVQGAVLPIDGDMVGTNNQWRCIAANTVRGAEHEVHVNKTFQVRYNTTPNSANQSAMMSVWTATLTLLFSAIYSS